MLNDSGSPHNDLQKLSEWRKLPETQEVLQYLRDKAQLAQNQVNKSPMGFQVNGHILDTGIINSLRDRFSGNREGFLELEGLLNQREAQLLEFINSVDQTK